jgi:hypothetical protein
MDSNTTIIGEEKKRGGSFLKKLFSFKNGNALTSTNVQGTLRSISPALTRTQIEPLDFKDSFKLETEQNEELKHDNPK